MPLTEIEELELLELEEEEARAGQATAPENGNATLDETSDSTPEPTTVGDKLRGFGERTMERSNAVYAPTALGERLGLKQGTVGEAIVGTPERAVRLGLGAVGTLADIPATAIGISAGGYNQLLGGLPGKVAKGIGEATGISGKVRQIGEKYGEWKQGLPEAAQANITATESGIGALGMKGGVGIAKKIEMPTLGPSSIEKVIDKGINKGIKPTVKNKSNYTAMSKFNERANDAVKTMAENKDIVTLVDDAGETISHPRNAAEMAQAIEKTKRVIYKQYHDMAVVAGDKGAEFSFKPIESKLDAVSRSLKNNPQIRNYAQELKEELKELDGASPEIIEERIKDLNKSLNGFYEGRVSKVKAEIDASVANAMREQLDNIIENASGSGYQELKNKYGSLKAIEKEVNHRAIVNARKGSKGMLDFTDIFTGGDLIAGVLSLNPALIAKSLVGRGVKEVYKELNRPDRYIDAMFKRAYKEYTPGPKTFATPEKPIIAETPDILHQQPAYSRAGVDIKGRIKKDKENLDRARSRPVGDIGAWHRMSRLP